MHANRTIAALFAALMILTVSSLAPADAILPGLYTLHNHPDGAISPPPYGLRLDNLYNVDLSNPDRFTFDFDHPSSSMYLVYNDVTQKITIDGVSHGGRDVGNAYANDSYLGLYTIHFEYDMNVGVVPGDDDLWSNAPSHSNFGSIMTPLGDTIILSDVASGGMTFRFGDENNDNGHRGFDGLSGWGWLAMNGARTSEGSDDWLFTATHLRVPEPATMIFLASGLVGCLSSRRRK